MRLHHYSYDSILMD